MWLLAVWIAQQVLKLMAFWTAERVLKLAGFVLSTVLGVWFLMAVGGTFPQAMQRLPLFAAVRADPHGTALKELDQPRLDHVHIAEAVAACHWKTWNGSLASLSPQGQDLLRITKADLEVESRARAPMAGDAPLAAPTESAAVTMPDTGVPLTYYERAALYQSDRVRADRLGYAAQADQREQRLRSHQIVILLINAAAAFLIGLKTLALNKDPDVAFRPLMAGALLPLSIFALLMPVIGTAMSGMVAFDDDASAILRDGRTVSQLEQLHGRIVADIVGDPFFCQFDLTHYQGFRATSLAVNASGRNTLDDYESCRDDRFRRTVAWEQRHEQILNDATQTLAQAGNLPGPSAQQGDNASESKTTRPVSQAAQNSGNQAIQVATRPSNALRDPCQRAFYGLQDDDSNVTTVASSAPGGPP